MEATAKAATAGTVVPCLPLAAAPVTALDSSTGKKRRVTLSPPYDPELLLRYASAGVQVNLATATKEEEATVGTPTSRLEAAAAAKEEETAAAAAEEAEDESPGEGETEEEEHGGAAAAIPVVGPKDLRPHPTALPRIRVSTAAVRSASMPALTSLLPPAQAPAVAS